MKYIIYLRLPRVIATMFNIPAEAFNSPQKNYAVSLNLNISLSALLTHVLVWCVHFFRVVLSQWAHWK